MNNTLALALAAAVDIGLTLGSVAEAAPIAKIIEDEDYFAPIPRSPFDRGGYQRNPGEGLAAMMIRLGARKETLRLSEKSK